jgi:hypothetical protein
MNPIDWLEPHQWIRIGAALSVFMMVAYLVWLLVKETD